MAFAIIYGVSGQILEKLGWELLWDACVSVDERRVWSDAEEGRAGEVNGEFAGWIF